MSNAKRFISVIVAMIMILSTLVVGVNAYAPYKDEAILESQYDKVNKPILTTQQYASAAVDELDRMLAKENLKMSSDELYGIGSLDVTSVDATLKSVYDLVNGQSFQSLKSLLGDLSNLTADSFKNISRTSNTDLEILYAVLGFLYENKDIFVDFINGTIDLGSILPAALGDDLDEFRDVSKMLKSMLYEEVYTQKVYEEQPDGTLKKKKIKPDMDLSEHQEALKKSTYDGLVQELIDKSVLEKYPELTGFTNISTGSMYSLIDNVLKALFNGYLLEELNGSIKNEIKKLCGVEFKKNAEGSYIKDEDGNKIEDNRDNLNSYANYLNIDYVYGGYEFSSGTFMSQLNNILGSFIKVLVKDPSLVTWKDGTNAVLMDNLVGLAKTILLDFGSDFFAPYIKLADEATINKMNNEQLIVYALRAVINSFTTGMYIPDDVVTVIDFGYYTLAQLLATTAPELDFSSYAKNLDTLVIMAVDYAIHNLNATSDMGISFAYSMSDVDAQVKNLATYAIDNYGGLLNGVKLSKSDSGWTTLNKIIDGVLGLDWLPSSANKDIKTFLIDNLLTDIANLDLEKILSAFELSAFPASSNLNKSPKVAVINIVVKLFNSIFPGAFSPSATTFDALFSNASLANLIDALFSDLYNYRANLMQAGLPLACSMLDLTNEQEFEFPFVICDTFIYDSSSAPNFNITFRNNSSGINTAYRDAAGNFHQDKLYTYNIKSITSNISTLTLTPSITQVKAGEECKIKVNGTIASDSPFIVAVTYDVVTEDGSTLTAEPMTEYIYSYLANSAQDDKVVTKETKSGSNYRIVTSNSIYATSIGELTDAEVKIYNSTGTQFDDVVASIKPSGAAIDTINIAVNDEKTVLLAKTGNNDGVTSTKLFKTTDAYKALTAEEKTAVWEAICATGTAARVPGRYAYYLGAKVGTTTILPGRTSYIFCFNDYDLDSLIASEVNKHRQKANYSAGWADWEKAMEDAVKVAYAPRVANNFASRTMTQYEGAAKNLNAAIAALDENEISGGVGETKAILASYSTSNEGKKYTDSDYSFFSVDDFVPHTYYAYRDEARAAQSIIDKAEAVDVDGNFIGVAPDALTVIYRNHRLNLYGGRLIRKTAVKAHLAKELANAAAQNYSASDYTEASWADYQEALNFATSVNNNASSTLEQSRVNTAYEMLLEYQKRLMPAGGSSAETSEYAFISSVSVVNTTDGKVLKGILGGGEFDTSYYFSSLKNCTVELVANDAGTYSTGAKVIVKDSTGATLETYVISVFDDVNGDGLSDANDTFTITCCATGVSTLDSQYLVFAGDMNADGYIDGNDTVGSSAISAGSAVVDYVKCEVVY